MHDFSHDFSMDIQNKLGKSPKNVIFDGKIHRFDIKKKGDNAGWYVGFNDNLPAGSFGSWQTSEVHKWCAKPDIELTSADLADNKARFEQAKAKRDFEQAQRHKDAAQKAASIWNSAPAADANHHYLMKKQAKPHGLRQSRGALVVSVTVNGDIASLQFIQEDGSKKFLSGGALKAGYYSIASKDNDTNTIVLCEGFATGASLHEATGYSVAVAFNAGNLEPVARALRAKYQDSTLIIAPDDDYKNKINSGLKNGLQAAKSVGAFIVPPPFNRGDAQQFTDWNDYYCLRGKQATKMMFDAILDNCDLITGEEYL